jgi:hypothetical protein
MSRTILLSCLLAAGCSPVATYPSVETNTAKAFANAAHEPTPTVIVKTLEFAHDRWGGTEEIVFNLPEGVSSGVYDIVAARMDGSRPMASEDEPAFHITELRIRGLTAQADIIFPSTANGLARATVYLETTLVDPWRVNRERVWLIPVESAPPPHWTSVDIP